MNPFPEGTPNYVWAAICIACGWSVSVHTQRTGPLKAEYEIVCEGEAVNAEAVTGGNMAHLASYALAQFNLMNAS